jgi:Carboxypeptidase regulatory-like domain
MALVNSKRMRLLMVVLLLDGLVTSAVWAKDCKLSKEFSLNQSQTLSSVLDDPSGAQLSYIDLQLLAEKKVIKQTTTSADGNYSFGDVAPGRYRIRIIATGNGQLFCAPKVTCGVTSCSIEPRVQLDPKKFTTVIF